MKQQGVYFFIKNPMRTSLHTSTDINIKDEKTQKIFKRKNLKETIFLYMVTYPFGAINETCQCKANGVYRIYSHIENPTPTKNLINIMTVLQLCISSKDYFHTKGAGFLPNEDVEYQ